MRAPLVPVASAFAIGILLQGVLAGWVLALCILVAAAGIFLTLRWSQASKINSMGLILLWVGLGAWRAEVWSAQTGGFPALSEQPTFVLLHAVVVQDPVVPFGLGGVPQQTFVMQLHHRRGKDAWEPIVGKVRVTVSDLKQKIVYGDEALLEGQWAKVPLPGNPGQFNWHSYLARAGIHALVRMRSQDALVILNRDQANPLLGYLYRLRRRWNHLIREAFPESDAGLLSSLLLGERVALEPQLKEAFMETGTIHLLVISGFNVGLIAWLLERLLRLVGIAWRARLILTAVILGFYAVLTGFQPPVLRATLMAWVVLGGFYLDRVVSWPNALAAAALGILLANPMQLFDPGFQLSFGAVASLIVLAGSFSHLVRSILGWLRPAWLCRYLGVSIGATAAIWVGLSPILAYFFHLLSPVSILANVLIAPLMSALIGVGTICLFLATYWNHAFAAAKPLLQGLLDANNHTVLWCQKIPAGHFWVCPPSIVWCFCYYVVLSLSLIRKKLNWSLGKIFLLWTAALAVWVWFLVVVNFLQARWLYVHFLDVGHGDCILIQTPQGQTFMVDAGSQEAGKRHVVPVLRTMGIRRLDALILTHSDEDHIGGAIPLGNAMRLSRLLTNGASSATMSAKTLREWVAEGKIPHQVVASGAQLRNRPENGSPPSLKLEVLHPPSGFTPGTAPEANDNSIVLRLSYGEVGFLLAGDIEEEGLRWLLEQPVELKSMVLKVPHHGSRLGAIGELFFRKVDPEIAILSVGRAHHLPSRQTLEALQATRARLFSTLHDGAVSLRTDGRCLEVKTFRGSKKWEQVSEWY